MAAPTGARATLPRVLAFARKEPSAVLFFTQLAALLVYPAMEGNEVGRALFSVLGIAFLGLVVLAVRSSPTWTWLGMLLAAPASVLLLAQAVSGSDALLPYSSALEAVLYFYAAGGADRVHARRPRDHPRRALRGRGDVHARGVGVRLRRTSSARRLRRESFTAAVRPTGDRSWVELLFLSFTTLSSTGLSDVVPIRPFARSLVMLEQVAAWRTWRWSSRGSWA